MFTDFPAWNFTLFNARIPALDSAKIMKGLAEPVMPGRVFMPFVLFGHCRPLPVVPNLSENVEIHTHRELINYEVQVK